MADFARGSTVVVSPKLQRQVYAHLPPDLSHYTSRPFLPAQVQEDRASNLPIALPRLRIDSLTGIAHFNGTKSATSQGQPTERLCPPTSYPVKANELPLRLNWDLHLVSAGTCDTEKPPTNKNHTTNVYPLPLRQSSPMEAEYGNDAYGAPPGAFHGANS